MSLESSVTELVNQASELIDVFNQKKAGIEQAVKDAFSAAPSKLEKSISYTIGPGGDFETINAALYEAQQKLPGFGVNGQNYRVTLNLLSGFVMQEQVLVDYSVDFSFIRIEADDDEVSVDPDYLTNYFWGRYPLFGAARWSKLPVINVLFNMLDKPSKVEQHIGLFLTGGSHAYFMAGAGVKNSGGRGVDMEQFCIAFLDGADFSGAGSDGLNANSGCQADCSRANFDDAQGYAMRLASSHVIADNISAANCLFGVRLDERSSASLDNAEIPNAQNGEGIYARQGSIVNASNVKLPSAGLSGILALEGAVINAKNAVITDAGGYGISCRDGAIVIAAGADASGSANGGVYANGSGRVMAHELNARMTEGTDNSADFTVTGGGMIWSYNSIGGKNIALNTLTSSGIIFN